MGGERCRSEPRDPRSKRRKQPAATPHTFPPLAKGGPGGVRCKRCRSRTADPIENAESKRAPPLRRYCSASVSSISLRTIFLESIPSACAANVVMIRCVSTGTADSWMSSSRTSSSPEGHAGLGPQNQILHSSRPRPPGNQRLEPRRRRRPAGSRLPHELGRIGVTWSGTGTRRTRPWCRMISAPVIKCSS